MPKPRPPDRLRPVRIRRAYTDFAEGSVLIEMGRTRVLCNASVDETVPPFLRGTGTGWVTAEYAMLPRSTAVRSEREAVRGRPAGRTLEIGRLIGRSLRSAVDLAALGERSVRIDCDVLQADGGTRCAAITGGMVALADALAWMDRAGLLEGGAKPLRRFVAAVSVGLVDGRPVLDLDYAEDARAGVDMNVVMTDRGRYVELQGSSERVPFSDRDLGRMKRLARAGIARLIALQKRALGQRIRSPRRPG
ncbi:MAG: ribonuclease PH [Planctomycetota bacterium]